MTQFRTLILASLVLSSCTASLQAHSFSAVGDFSLATNPNGAWSYGWEATLGGTFNLDVNTQTTPFSGLETWCAPTYSFSQFYPLIGFNDTGSTLPYVSRV